MTKWTKITEITTRLKKELMNLITLSKVFTTKNWKIHKTLCVEKSENIEAKRTILDNYYELVIGGLRENMTGTSNLRNLDYCKLKFSRITNHL